MKIDNTLKITPRMVTDAQGNEKKSMELKDTSRNIHSFPMNYAEITGVPCRVVAEI